jgi:hypothetical protein
VGFKIIYKITKVGGKFFYLLLKQKLFVKVNLYKIWLKEQIINENSFEALTLAWHWGRW